jgi:hypothetical protein
MLNDFTDEALLSYLALAKNYKTWMTIKLLAKMITCLNQCKPEFVPRVTVKLVWLTIEHGIVSGFLFAKYSSYYNLQVTHYPHVLMPW